MTTSDVLAEAFARVQERIHAVVRGLNAEQLGFRADAGANSLAWLVWHLARIQDDHVAEVAGSEQQWTEGGWRQRFALPFEPGDTGYGHRPDQVAAVQVGDPALLTGYYDAVHQHTIGYLRGLRDADLDRIVDERWDPPVSLGVRLVSVLDDDIMHAGQAAFIRGLIERRWRHNR